jgi:hypothetical protein
MARRNAARLATALGGLAALLTLLGLLALVVPNAGGPVEPGDQAVLQIHEGGGMGGFSRMRVTLWDSGRVAFTTPDFVLREAHLDAASVARLRATIAALEPVLVVLDPLRELHHKKENDADEMAALLRAEAGRNPNDPALTALVQDLALRSEEFAKRWAAHNVRFHRNGIASFRHPQVGPLTLAYEDLDLPSDSDQTILVFTAEPGSPSEAALVLLAGAVNTMT